MYKQARESVNDRKIMKCFHKAGFVKNETEGVNAMDNFYEIYPEQTVDYWEDINSDSPTLYKGLYQRGSKCGCV